MKKLKFMLVISIFSLTLSFPIFASEQSNQKITIEPRASYVFSSVASGISPTGYAGDCSLENKGSGTLTISLQKYTSGSWATVSGTSSSKSFTNTTICAHSKSKTLSKGKYRCKTYVKATVGSHTDSRTVYSSTLTIN